VGGDCQVDAVGAGAFDLGQGGPFWNVVMRLVSMIGLMSPSPSARVSSAMGMRALT
jgi:hypothetical protein